MGLTSDFKTLLQYRIAMAAFEDAWMHECAFNVASFCRKHGFKDTRYLRTVLSIVAEKGYLYSYIVVDENSRKRRMYCAQKTKMIGLFAQGELTNE
jgi:hypothetical protein